MVRLVYGFYVRVASQARYCSCQENKESIPLSHRRTFYIIWVIKLRAGKNFQRVCF